MYRKAQNTVILIVVTHKASHSSISVNIEKDVGNISMIADNKPEFVTHAEVNPLEIVPKLVRVRSIITRSKTNSCQVDVICNMVYIVSEINQLNPRDT